MIKSIELGCAGHLIVSAYCRWKRHTQIGNYRVSTIGAYYQNYSDHEMTTIGADDDSFYETMIFKTINEPASDSEGCGCLEVESCGGIDGESYATAGKAQEGHEKYIVKYLKKARKEDKLKSC